MRRALGALLCAAAAAGATSLAAPAGALAAPPANDEPAVPGGFDRITAENGTPDERQAIAELVEATADAGVPRCLGDASFDRTVWFRVPESQAMREIAVEASGRTTAVLDLAAFVQPAGAPADRPLTAEPNACAGTGSGGADASEEPTAGVTLRIPANRAVLIQVGRRGPRGSADDERAILSLASRDLPGGPVPAGDAAGTDTPTVQAGAEQQVALGGATLTEEDPAQPPCPSYGSVWRRFVPSQSGSQVVTAGGAQVGTLTVFAGERPTGENVITCVNRERSSGGLSATVPAQAGVPLWVRLGTDRPATDATGTLRIGAAGGAGGAGAPGGPGGAGPGAGGPGAGGGAGAGRAACRPSSRAVLARQRITFRRRPSRVRRQNTFRTFPIRLGAVRFRLCAARIALVGPRGRVYARGTIRRVSGRRPSFRLRRVRRFVRGTYRLRATALSAPGSRRVRIRTRGVARFR